jgi:hypothetical protein
VSESSVDKNYVIESLKEKLEQEEYKLYDLFMEDLEELESNDRHREFIFVSHNYISKMIDNIILNYFVSLEKREEFEICFNVPKLGFSRKLDIAKKSNLIPKEIYRVLNDFNKIRNIIAHNVDWLKKLDTLDNLIIRKDKKFLYGSVPLWFMFLGLYLDFSKKSKKERKQLNKELEILAKELGMSIEELFSF